MAYRWPGNVRELANVMERAVLLNDGGAIEPKDLAMLPAEAPASEFQVIFPPGGIVWADLEKSLIEQALAQAGGNQVRAAKLLGLSRDALRYRMEKYGLGDVSRAATAARTQDDARPCSAAARVGSRVAPRRGAMPARPSPRSRSPT